MTPTAREIIADMAPPEARCSCNRCLLTTRVEAVLALQPKGWAGWDICLAEVLMLLDGEQP